MKIAHLSGREEQIPPGPPPLLESMVTAPKAAMETSELYTSLRGFTDHRDVLICTLTSSSSQIQFSAYSWNALYLKVNLSITCRVNSINFIWSHTHLGLIIRLSRLANAFPLVVQYNLLSWHYHNAIVCE